jgi:hypothetical protein
MGLSIEEIKELAKSPRQITSGDGSLRSVAALVELKDSTTSITLKDTSFDYAGAMQGAREGHRNTTLHKLISSDRAHDLPREAGEVHALTFADKCDPPMDQDEALAVVESVYTSYPPGHSSEVYPYSYPIGEVRQVHPKLERFSDTQPPQDVRKYVVESMAIKGHPIAMFGDGGVAKSTVAMDLGQRVARGEDWMGRNTMKMSIMLLDFELDSNEQHRRAYEVAAGQGYKKPPDDFYYVCAAGLPTKEVFRFALERCKELSIGWSSSTRWV